MVKVSGQNHKELENQNLEEILGENTLLSKFSLLNVGGRGKVWPNLSVPEETLG